MRNLEVSKNVTHRSDIEMSRHELLQTLKGQKDAELYSIILKQKHKILDLQSQVGPINIPMTILQQLNFLVQALEMKENSINELKLKNKEISAELNEVKRTRKVYQDENLRLKKEFDVRRKKLLN